MEPQQEAFNEDLIALLKVVKMLWYFRSKRYALYECDPGISLYRLNQLLGRFKWLSQN